MIRKPLMLVGILLGTTGCEHNSGTLQIQLRAKLTFATSLTDVSGYFDPGTGTEYAIAGYGGGNGGVYIVDVTRPDSAREVVHIDNVPGFDVKVWQHYLYTVTGGGNGEGAIIDLSSPGNPKVVGSFPSSHNIFIDENGFMYAEDPKLRIFALNPDPLHPSLIWEGGVNGHDATVVGDRLYDFHGTFGTNIYNISDPTTPALLSTINAPFVTFHHSGWPSQDGNFLFICDEGARNPDQDITVWDISNVSNPEFVGGYIDSTAIVHNLFIINDIAYASFYTAGFKVFDVSDPRSMQLLDEYDTNALTGDSFGGAFGVYPFAESGNIYVTGSSGLHIFSLAGAPSSSQTILGSF